MVHEHEHSRVQLIKLALHVKDEDADRLLLHGCARIAGVDAADAGARVQEHLDICAKYLAQKGVRGSI